jgi:multidrug efflux pump subunit AcrA (membrane-fusion protein)
MTISVVHPQKASITIPMLPGQTEAYTDAPIHAQTSGYLKNWYFDIGAKVKAGAWSVRMGQSRSEKLRLIAISAQD